MAIQDRFSRRTLFVTAGILLSTACSSTAAVSGVYVVGPGESEPRLVGMPAGAPVWSPDGAALLWKTERGIEIWIAAGGERDLLLPDAIAGIPAFSPGGDQIAYVRFPEPELVLFDLRGRAVNLRVDARAPGTAPLMTQVLDFGAPSWSPDGQQVAFSCWDGAGDEICVLDVASGQVTRLTRLSEELGGRIAAGETVNATSNVGPPAWSPDGALIAVAAYPERRGAASGLFLIDVARGSARRLVDHQPNSTIVWAADSSAVVFSASSGDRSDVYRFGADGTSSTIVTEALSGSFRNPALHSSGDVLAASNDGAIVRMRGNQEVGRIAVEGLFADYPAAQSAGDTISFQAAPDLIPDFRTT